MLKKFSAQALSSGVPGLDIDGVIPYFLVSSLFGYAGQAYCIAEDGSASLFQIAVQGGDGIIGFSDNAGKPAAFTGGEAADFPKACAQWYSVTGTTVTSVTGDGQELSLEYTP